MFVHVCVYTCYACLRVVAYGCVWLRKFVSVCVLLRMVACVCVMRVCWCAFVCV